MSDDGLHDDFSARAIVHGQGLSWAPSPMPGVWRKRLERSGPAEAGRVTSIVRYEPGSRFRAHPHPEGEEILVLEGVFSDHTGDHGPGSYLINPEGFEHAPFSEPGCVILVKLRQHPGEGRRTIRVDAGDEACWKPHPEVAGARWVPLHDEPGWPERMHLLELPAGTRLPRVRFPRGEELFVLEGRYADEHGTYGRHSWTRHPPGSTHQLHTDAGCRLYVKKGHL